MTRNIGERLVVAFVWIGICFVAMSAPSAGQQPAPTSTAVVLEGRVIHQGTSDAIPQATVTLIRMHPSLPLKLDAIAGLQSVATLMTNPMASVPGYIDGFLIPTAQLVNVPPDVLRPQSLDVVISDAAGRFAFGDLVPGRYCLTTQRDGYLDPLAGGYAGSPATRIIVVEAGKQPPIMDLAMIRPSSISGRVIDSLGQPVPNASVDASQLWYPSGRPSWNAEYSKSTNDRGEFRLFGLSPGEYFIGVTPRPRGANSAPLASVATTYFPGTIEPREAKAITLKEGDDVRDINFNLQAITLRTYTISGTVANTLPDRLLNKTPKGAAIRATPSFYLVPVEPSVSAGLRPPSFVNALRAESAANGEFEIRDVRPGIYDLYPDYDNFNSRRVFTHRTPIEVKNADVKGVTITLSPGSTLTAEVIIDGASTLPFKLNTLGLSLTMLDSTPQSFALTLGSLPFDSAGKLSVENLIEARYAIGVSGLPLAAYVADIQQADKSVFDEGLVLTPQARPIQIHIRLDGPSVTGIVRTAEQQAAKNTSVILAPPPDRRKNSALFKVVNTDSEGRFTIPGVMPGPYTIFAVRDRPFREPWLNAEFLARYQDQARPVVVEEGSSQKMPIELTVP
jgi:protocatechuate 3,4-dioxygenase beta subunit